MFDKPAWTHKVLTGLNQKVSGQVWGPQRSPTADAEPPADRRDPNRLIPKMNEVTPSSSRKGKRTVRRAHRAAAEG
jgi:hypothetical protein